MSTELNNGILQGGELPTPVKGEQYGVGAKFDLLGDRLTPTLAYFDIRRKDGLVSGPNDPTFRTSHAFDKDSLGTCASPANDNSMTRPQLALADLVQVLHPELHQTCRPSTFLRRLP